MGKATPFGKVSKTHRFVHLKCVNLYVHYDSIKLLKTRKKGKNRGEEGIREERERKRKGNEGKRKKRHMEGGREGGKERAW